MKLPKNELKKLQLEWYARLKAEGFNDIESFVNGTLVLNEYAGYRCKNLERQVWQKEAYYYSIYQIVMNEDTEFRNEVDKLILTLHAEGKKKKEIREELSQRGTPRCRVTIRTIIRRYEIKWGFRFYSDNELNIYKK